MALSACWIVKNEEETLARSIESLLHAVDDLVVVDTGSTDSTVEVAKSFGARVEHFDWIDDFSAARNYAMSLTKHNLVLFLDADEWFETALTATDGQKMEKLFRDHPNIETLQLEMKHLKHEKDLFQVTEQPRLLRKSNDLAYLAPIHEYYAHKNGRPVVTTAVPMWRMLHTGYTEDFSAIKLNRSMTMLKTYLETCEDPREIARACIYLVREHFFAGDYEGGIDYLRAILRSPEMFAERAKDRGNITLTEYTIQYACAVKRKLSRREVWDKLFRAEQTGFSAYPGVPLIPLYYQSMFDLKEDVFLREFGPAMEKRRAIPEFPTKLYDTTEALVYATAAYALDRRGDMLGAFDNATASIQASKKYCVAMVALLLKLMRGQPAQDVALFLNSLFDTDSPEQLGFLAESTMREGFLEVYAYYQSKRYKISGIDRLMQMDLLFTQKKYDEAVIAALAVAGEGDARLAAAADSCLAALCVCIGDMTLHRRYAQAMPETARMVEAYYQGVVLENRSQEENDLFPIIYKNIALVEGVERADRFAHIFSGFPKLVFTSRAPYLLNSWHYAELANAALYGIDASDYDCYTYVIHAQIYLGQYDKAYETIRRFLEMGLDESDLLTGLLVVVEKFEEVEDPRTADARALYSYHMEHHDALIDLRDIVKSGYAPDDMGKNRTKKLKTATMEAFLRRIQEQTQGKWITPDLLRAHIDAAHVYEEQESFAMAAQSYGIAYQGSEKFRESDIGAPLFEEAREGLTRAFFALGNGTLARAFTDKNER